MGIFDKILGKEEKAKKPEAKTEKVKAEKKVEEHASQEAKSEEKPKVKKEKPEKPKNETAKRKIVKKEDNLAHKFLLENLISEKSTLLASQNKYVFKVTKQAGKFQIKEAIEGYYGVQVVGVNTIKINPKKRVQGKTVGWKKGYKKAIVTLREGDAIGAAEGV